MFTSRASKSIPTGEFRQGLSGLTFRLLRLCRAHNLEATILAPRVIASLPDLGAYHVGKERLNGVAQARLRRNSSAKRAPAPCNAVAARMLLHCRKPAKLIQARGRSATHGRPRANRDAQRERRDLAGSSTLHPPCFTEPVLARAGALARIPNSSSGTTSLAFAPAGTYPYHCTIHGLIISGLS